jgi:urea transport system ATP-binding protein
METLLNISDLNFSYGEVAALRNVNMVIPKGQITCLMGRNGVGKTTLAKVVMGVLSPKSGSINFQGTDIRGMRSHNRVRRGLGYVPQGRMIFPRLTVEENLRVGLNGGDDKSGKLPEHIYELFPILKDFLKRRGGDLSGGQQQQLAIARALVTRPELLILDEPTEGIQPNVIKQIGAVLRHLVEKSGMTVLMIEQYVDFVKEVSHQFCVMNRGTVVAHGPTVDLSNDIIQEYLHV